MTLSDLLVDTDFARKLMLALQAAVVSKFSESDWLEIGYQTGEEDYISSHYRLLRSLRFGDDDYGATVFKVLRHFSEQNPNVLQAIIDNKKIKLVLEDKAPNILSELGLNVTHVPAVTPKSISASEVVERALADADHLLHTSGPISCVDRLHTALHGYLLELCANARLPNLEGASVTALFKQLRTKHPQLQHLGVQDNDVGRILLGFASVIDAINTIRNNASVAHPKDTLLGEAEAALVINVIRTLFHYISTKVRQ